MTFFWDPAPTRVNPTAMYAEHVDLRLFVCVGDEIMCAGDWSIVRKIKVYRVGSRKRPPHATVRRDWDALGIETDAGTRWFGYPPRALPTVPVTRKRPLW